MSEPTISEMIKFLDGRDGNHFQAQMYKAIRAILVQRRDHPCRYCQEAEWLAIEDAKGKANERTNDS